MKIGSDTHLTVFGINVFESRNIHGAVNCETITSKILLVL